jgi:hypothetical protein
MATTIKCRGCGSIRLADSTDAEDAYGGCQTCRIIAEEGDLGLSRGYAPFGEGAGRTRGMGQLLSGQAVHHGSEFDSGAGFDRRGTELDEFAHINAALTDKARYEAQR